MALSSTIIQINGNYFLQLTVPNYGLTFGDYLFSKDITTKLTGYHDFIISEVPNYG